MHRTKEIFVEVLKEAGNKKTVLVGDVYYTLGGMNIFSGTKTGRGFYFSVQLRERETTKYGTSDSFMMFGPGVSGMILQADRFNGKVFAKLQPTAEQIDQLKAKVREQIAKLERESEAV